MSGNTQNGVKKIFYSSSRGSCEAAHPAEALGLFLRHGLAELHILGIHRAVAGPRVAVLQEHGRAVAREVGVIQQRAIRVEAVTVGGVLQAVCRWVGVDSDKGADDLTPFRNIMKKILA